MAGGRKSSLTAEIDDYSIVGEIGVNITSVRETFGQPSVDAHKAMQIRKLCMSVVRERSSREGCKPSTILQDTTRLSGVAPWRDERPITPYFQRDWAFPASFPLHSQPVEFTLFSGLPFSVRPVFSVLTGPSPKVVQLG